MATELTDVSILKDHLDKTANMCTNLLQTLEHQVSGLMHQDQILDDNKKDTEMASGSINEVCHSNDPDVIREENCCLKEALNKMEEKFQKVIEINHRWQMYNQQRDEYIQFLHSTMQEMRNCYDRKHECQPQAQSKQENRNNGIDLQKKTQLDEVLEEQRKTTDELTKLKLENGQLAQANTEKEHITRILRDEIAQLKNVGNEQQEVKEKFAMMQQQIQIYEQDFQQERNDRERAQAKIQQLEQELLAAKTQLSRVYEHRGKQCYMVPTQHNEGCKHHGVGLYQCDGEDTDAEDHDEADCQLSPPEASPSCLANGTALSCPRCKSEFTVENHKHFLEHTEICSE